MTEGLLKQTLSPARQWLIERGYMKHPKDKAERMYINDKKSKRRNRNAVPQGPARSVPSDSEEE